MKITFKILLCSIIIYSSSCSRKIPEMKEPVFHLYHYEYPDEYVGFKYVLPKRLKGFMYSKTFCFWRIEGIDGTFKLEEPPVFVLYEKESKKIVCVTTSRVLEISPFTKDKQEKKVSGQFGACGRAVVSENSQWLAISGLSSDGKKCICSLLNLLDDTFNTYEFSEPIEGLSFSGTNRIIFSDENNNVYSLALMAGELNEVGTIKIPNSRVVAVYDNLPIFYYEKGNEAILFWGESEIGLDCLVKDFVISGRNLYMHNSKKRVIKYDFQKKSLSEVICENKVNSIGRLKDGIWVFCSNGRVLFYDVEHKDKQIQINFQLYVNR
jgi:hypothetical protein